MWTTPLGVIGLIGVICLLLIFANLSKRLGAVTKMKPYYRGFYVAIALVILAALMRLRRGSASLMSPTEASFESERLFYLATYYAPYVIAAVISVIVALLYWSWLFREKQQ